MATTALMPRASVDGAQVGRPSPGRAGASDDDVSVAQREHPVGLGEPMLDVVRDEHARRAGVRGRSAARPSRRPPGRGARAARPAAAARADAAPHGRSPSRCAIPRDRLRPARRRARVMPVTSSRCAMRASGSAHVVQARVEAQVLATGEVAVQERIVRQEPDAAAARGVRRAEGREPSTRTVPSCGISSVASMRRSVVFPAPLGPNTARVCPCSRRGADRRAAPRARRSDA